MQERRSSNTVPRNGARQTASRIEMMNNKSFIRTPVNAQKNDQKLVELQTAISGNGMPHRTQIRLRSLWASSESGFSSDGRSECTIWPSGRYVGRLTNGAGINHKIKTEIIRKIM